MNILKVNLIVAGLLLVLPAAQACQPDFAGQILNACGNQDLLQLESDAVTTFLQLHHLPQSGSNIIYQYGRADLRNEIRGLMFDDLIRIINEDPSALSPHEQNLFDWFNGLVQTLQMAQWNHAVTDVNSWKANPCTWRPDPAVASAYGLTYDPGEWCSGNPLVQAFSTGGPVPSVDYFMAAALKNTFGAQVTNIPYGAATEESVQQEGYLMYGYAAAPAAGLSFEGAVATYGFFLSAPSTGMIANAAAIETETTLAINKIMQAEGLSFGQTSSATEAAEAAGEEAIAAADSSAAADFAAGPAAIIIMAVEIGVEAGFDFFNYNDAVNALNSILNYEPIAPFDYMSLSALANDSTGMYKLLTTFTAQTLPDVPSTQPLPEHQTGVDPYFVLEDPNTGIRTEVQTLKYTDLAGTTWNVQTYQGFFLQSGTLTNGTVANSISPTLTITDPQGTTWAVDWTGSTFLLTKTQPADTDTVCAANPTPGVSIETNYQTCSSYVAFNFQLQDGTIVSLGQAPVFTSDPIGAFPAGQSFSVNITAAGIPTPAIGPTGFIPPGISVSGGANGLLTLSGLASLGQGVYTIPLQATNGSGRATQNFTLVLGGATPQIVSPDQFNDNGGVATSFTIHAAGYPVPKISLGSDFVMPNGYTFHDNGNGTATISGTDPGGVDYISLNGGPENVIGGTVVASNVLATASQHLAINFVPAPTPAIVGESGLKLTTTFSPGIQNLYTVATTGATTPVAFTFNFLGQRPPWLGFRDNGNGTATFFGIPPSTATPYNVLVGVTPKALGQNGIILGATLTIQVSAAPIFTDTGKQLMRNCPVNEPCGLDAHTNMLAGTLSLSGNVPAGLTLSALRPSDGQLNFETATGGAYPVSVTATNSYGSASQVYTFYILQAPGFPTATGNQLDIWLMEKVPASYSIPTTGYPHDVGVYTPGGTQILPPMTLSLEGILPHGLTFSDQTSAGIPTGTALISGTPTEINGETGFGLTLKANNGLTSGLNIQLHVRPAGDVNNDGQVNCTDVNAIKAALGSYAGQPNYNVLADINNDGAVNVVDLALVAPYLPKGCPLQ